MDEVNKEQKDGTKADPCTAVLHLRAFISEFSGAKRTNCTHCHLAESTLPKKL
jgi:hypothetical protein